MIKLYNTLSRQLEDVIASPDHPNHLNMYTCGPTVYNYAHIGNLRSFIVADLLYRTLTHDGYNPRWVMNLTDIDDKTIKGAVEQYGKAATVDDLRAFTQTYIDAFYKDLDEVHVLRDKIEFIRVTDKIPEIQAFILQLIDKGYAYIADDGSTYFSIEKYQQDFGDYGRLVGEKFLEGKKVGARVKVDEYDKDNLSDFALWKAHTADDANIFWDHPTLGKGRPGWHIECSVINHVAFNGEPTDIHTGGVDLIFPHHTNEIAQSQALVGKGNFVKHWLHSEHILVDGKKMAKSLNNFYRLADTEAKGFSGSDLRFLFCEAHYRAQQNFTWDALLAAHNGLDRAAAMQTGGTINEEEIKTAAANDLGIPDAVAAVFSQNISLFAFNQLFGLDRRVTDEWPQEVNELLQSREQARNSKNFSESDELRKKIEDLGYDVMDTPDGQKVKKKIVL